MASRNESGQDTTRPKGCPCLGWRRLNYLNYAPLNAHMRYSKRDGYGVSQPNLVFSAICFSTLQHFVIINTATNTIIEYKNNALRARVCYSTPELYDRCTRMLHIQGRIFLPRITFSFHLVNYYRIIIL